MRFGVNGALAGGACEVGAIKRVGTRGLGRGWQAAYHAPMDISLFLPTVGKSFLFALAAILPIINPFATAPIFLQLTRGVDRNTRAMLARRIGFNAAMLLIGATLVGSYVLSFFGISLPVVRLAGGLIVASIAWRMLNAQHGTDDEQAQVTQSVCESNMRVRAFYPLTFPISCGPGTIAAAIAVGASLHTRSSVTETLLNTIGGLMAMVLLGALVGLVLRYADRLLALLGEVGSIVFLRLMAFLLLCVGVQIMWDGVRGLLQSL